MAFLENLTKKVGEAAQTAAKKSGELVEITKLNLSVNAEEDKINKLYLQIGKKIYASYISGVPADNTIEEDCRTITEHEGVIKELKEKIMDVKNVKACMGCGAEMEKNAMFCVKCGTKVESSEPAAPVQEEKFCPSCGAKVAGGAAFCPGCGSKIE